MLNEFMKDVHKNAVEHGWWEEKRTFGEIIALCHSELSEALEEHRNKRQPTEIYYSGIEPYDGRYEVSKQPDEVCKKPEGIPIELADCIIRILDYCGKENIDIDESLKIKHEYNKTRAFKHGGKVI